LFEGGFEIIDDFLGENVGIGKIVEVFEALAIREVRKVASSRISYLTVSK
jgi:hypothetical protein